MTDTLQAVDAQTVKGWLESDKAILIDIRETDEFAREHVPGAHLVPLSGFDTADFPHDHEKIAVFHCASGNRTCEAAPKILQDRVRDVDPERLRGHPGTLRST